MGRNLGPLNIKDSYQELVQISGSILTDGVGVNIDSLTVTASYATTAEASISASYAQTSTSASYATTATSASYAATASFAENATIPNLQEVLDKGGIATNATASITGPDLVNEIFQVYGVDSGGGNSIIASFGSNISGAGNQKTVRFIDSATNGALVQLNAYRGTAKIDSQLTALEIESFGDLTLDPQGSNIVLGGFTTSSFGIKADGGFTGSLFGTSSYAVTASYAENAGASTLQEVLDNSNVATGVDIILTGSYLRHSASFSGNVIDNLTTPTASEAINHIVYLSQTEYNAIPTPDTNTLYVISGSSVIAASNLQEVLDAGNTATQDIYLSGSIATTGSVIIDTLDDTANALYIKGGRVVVDSGNFTDSVWVNIGNNNTFTSTDKSPVMSLGAGISNQSAANGVAFGENHTINSSGYNTFIGGGNGNVISSNKSAIIGGTSNTNSHLNAVILGGTSLQTTANEQTVVSTLLVSGSGGGVTFPDGTTQTTAALPTFPYTGSANISGSIELVGPLNLYDPKSNANGINIGVIGQTANIVSGNPSNPGVAIGYGNGNAANFNQHFIIGKNNVMNFQGNGEASFIFGRNNTVGGNFNRGNVILGTNHTMASDARYSIFAGGDSHQLSGSIGNYSGVVAGLNNTLAHSQSVILGGENITTTAHGTTFTPNLCLTGSGATLTFGDGTTQTTAGGSPFPYTGSAEITGSLDLVGSITTGKSNNNISGTSYGHAIIGGEQAVISTSAEGSAIIAGYSANITGGGVNAMVASQGTISNGYYQAIIANDKGQISATGWSNAIVGGLYGVISGGAARSAILGGASSDVVGGQNTVIIGGTNNYSTHNNSVVLGGVNITSTANETVFVPHLDISGSVTGDVGVLTDVAGTTTMDCKKSNFFTLAMPAGGSTTLTPTNIQAGQTISVKITQNATPSTIAFAASVDFESGTPFAVSTGAGEVDVMTFISFDGTTLQATGLKNFS